MRSVLVIFAAIAFFYFTCSAAQASSQTSLEKGYATWYYFPSTHTQRMANGNKFAPTAMHAAHRTLKLGTIVRITRLDTMAHVEVKITDRVPRTTRRIIVDLTPAAADVLNMRQIGRVAVALQIMCIPSSEEVC